jgi:hypothetical protein
MGSKGKSIMRKIQARDRKKTTEFLSANIFLKIKKMKTAKRINAHMISVRFGEFQKYGLNDKMVGLVSSHIIFAAKSSGLEITPALSLGTICNK